MKNVFFVALIAVFSVTNAVCADPQEETKDLLSLDSKDKAYSLTVGSEIGIEIQREGDLLYTYADALCCCTYEILSAFESASSSIADMINPSTDTLIGILALELQDSRLRREQMSNLKIVNGLYSFSDEENPAPPAIPMPESVPAEGLCRPIDPNKQEDLDWYRENITDRFESSGSYDAMNCSGAFGRYQMMPQYASDPSNPNRWCLYGGAGCCAKTGTITKRCNGKNKVFDTYAWQSSATCQDNMFDKLTRDNMAQLGRKYPVTSCNMYLVHQQGLGGFAWLMGGKNPYGSFSRLQTAVKQNVGQKRWAEAVANGDTQTEEGLRKVYQDFWKEKFGADPFSGDGTTGAGSAGAIDSNVSELTGITEMASEGTERDKYRREGILLELYREIYNMSVNWKLVDSRVDEALNRAK